MEDLSALAPLHNPPNILGVRACQKIFPGTPQAGVFDTAFHQTMPEEAYLYAIPYTLYKEHGIRRYGFHGTSHRYVSARCAELEKKSLSEMKIITCHLGNGASMAAIHNGKSVDTTMGLTPLEGLVMGTRCGDIDAGILFHMHDSLKMSMEEINKTLNKKSGVLGITGNSNDMRILEDKMLKDKDRFATLAHQIYAYRIKKYIGAYVAAMNGCDCLIFTGGVGENSPPLREMACAGMDFLGISLDLAVNDKTFRGKEGRIDAKSKVKVYVVPTNEELMIARDTIALTLKKA
jgi:acetate kinase